MMDFPLSGVGLCANRNIPRSSSVKAESREQKLLKFNEV